MTKIDKYQGYIFEGKGYIKDHQMWRKVIKLDFPIEDSEKDIRREMDNYINHAKASGFQIGASFGEFSAYVQLVATIAQVEYNKQVKKKVEVR